MTVTSRQSLLRVARMWHGRVLARQPGLSAWEAVPSGLVTWPDLRGGVSASDRERLLFTGVNGPLMARGSGSLISPSLGFHQRGLPEMASNLDLSHAWRTGLSGSAGGDFRVQAVAGCPAVAPAGGGSTVPGLLLPWSK